MTVKVSIEISDAEFAGMLADAIGGGTAGRASQALADAGLTPDTRQGTPSASQADPWDEPEAALPAPPPPAAQSTTAARTQAQTIIVNNPKGKQQWTLGAERAPTCNCGELAAYVVGSTNGKTWKRWACSRGAGEDWRNKCDFSEWVR